MSLKVIQNGCGFIFAFHSNYGSILHLFRDKARYWSQIVIFSYPLAFGVPSPVRGSPSEYCHPVWHGKSQPSPFRLIMASEPSVMRDLLHGTIYLIIFNPSLTLPVLNDSSKLFCFLHALIIEQCNVSRTIV